MLVVIAVFVCFEVVDASVAFGAERAEEGFARFAGRGSERRGKGLVGHCGVWKGGGGGWEGETREGEVRLWKREWEARARA